MQQLYHVWTHPLNRPKYSLITIFIAWKLLLLAIAATSPGSGYDTSTTLHASANILFPTKLLRWDAIYFTQIARRGYLFEQDWAFGWGFTRFLAILGACEKFPFVCTWCVCIDFAQA
jgi:phosphatidylinositol glycan class V